MRDREAVRDSSSIHGVVISTRSPVTLGFLWDEAHGLEEGGMMRKLSMCSNSCFAAWRHSGGSLRGWVCTGRPVVVIW